MSGDDEHREVRVMQRVCRARE